MQVCNHPELFERKDARTPYYMFLDDYSLPKLVYREGILEQAFPRKSHIYYNKLYVHSPDHVQHATSHHQGECNMHVLKAAYPFSITTIVACGGRKLGG